MDRQRCSIASRPRSRDSPRWGSCTTDDGANPEQWGGFSNEHEDSGSAVSLSLSLSSLTFAGSDISAASIQLQDSGSNVTVVMNVGLDTANLSSFEFSVTLKQLRNGQLVTTHHNATHTASATQLCPACSSTCASTCVYSYDGIFSTTGPCYKTDDGCGGSSKLCGCANVYSGGLSIAKVALQSGDVLEMTVAPGTGLTDSNSNNNTITTTY